MYFKVVLACALIAVVSAQTANGTASLEVTINTPTTRRPFSLQFLNALTGFGGAIKSGIGLFNTSAHTATDLVGNGVKGFSEAGQKAVSTASNLGSTALKGGVDAAKQAVDIGVNMASMIPGFGGLVSIGGGMAKAGADVANMFGQTGISVGSGIANGKLQLASGLTSAGAGLAANGVRLGADAATKGVDTGLQMAGSAIGTVGNVVDTAMDYANRASGRVSSLASTTADRMSLSTGGSWPFFNFQLGGSGSG